MNTFKDKVVLITGASSGIGLAAARSFAARGATLMLAARDAARLDEAVLLCRNSGGRCEAVVTDIQSTEQVVHLVKSTIESFGRIDVLVNNAGMGTQGLFHLQPWSSIEQTLQTNLTGALAVSHAVIPQMVAQKSGVIVNVSSVIGKRAIPLLSAYCATKFALWGFSDSLRRELRPLGIHVCHFCPAATRTDFQRRGGLVAAANAVSAELVGEALVYAVTHKKNEYIVSRLERLLIKAHLLAPNLVNFLLGYKK